MHFACDDTDHTTPRPLRLAAPFFGAFLRSGRCPLAHRAHARSSLPLIALFISTLADERHSLPWERMRPELFAAMALDVDPADRRFARDLLELTAAYYRWLGESELVATARATQIAVALDAIVESLFGLDRVA